MFLQMGMVLNGGIVHTLSFSLHFFSLLRFSNMAGSVMVRHLQFGRLLWQRMSEHLIDGCKVENF